MSRIDRTWNDTRLQLAVAGVLVIAAIVIALFFLLTNIPTF